MNKVGVRRVADASGTAETTREGWREFARQLLEIVNCIESRLFIFA